MVPEPQFRLHDSLGLEIEPFSRDEPRAKVDITCYAMDYEGAVHLNCAYNRDLYDRRTIEWLMQQMERILSAAAEDVAVALPSIALTTTAQRADLIASFNEPLED
jgi:hypothetical protein